jgi:hypothetical protein
MLDAAGDFDSLRTPQSTHNQVLKGEIPPLFYKFNFFPFFQFERRAFRDNLFFCSASVPV